MVDASTGEVTNAKAYDTYKCSEVMEYFIDNLLPDNHIVVAACQDDCANRLSVKIKAWFKELGSKEIDNVQYRSGFVFIG